MTTEEGPFRLTGYWSKIFRQSLQSPSSGVYRSPIPSNQDLKNRLYLKIENEGAWSFDFDLGIYAIALGDRISLKKGT